MLVDLESTINLQVAYKEKAPARDMTSLPGVGFHPKREVDVLHNDLLAAKSTGENPRSVLKRWLSKAERNLKGYWQEYIDQRLVLPIEIEIAELDENKRIVPKGIRDRAWVDSIGSWERNGSVKDSAKKIEKFLLSAPIGSAAVLVSPAGFEYPDTQTYLFFVRSDELEAMTIRTDPNIEDNEHFLTESSTDFNPDKMAALDSRVESILRHPLLLASEVGFSFSPEAIIQTIRSTKSGQNAFKDKAFENLFTDFANRRDLLSSKELVEITISEFTDFCVRVMDNQGYSLDQITRKFIEDKLGETVLKLSYIKRRLQGKIFNFEAAVHKLHNLNSYDYYAELRYLQTIPGCAGGGLNSTPQNYIENGFGLRESINSKTCKNCGTTVGVSCGWCVPCWQLLHPGE